MKNTEPMGNLPDGSLLSIAPGWEAHSIGLLTQARTVDARQPGERVSGMREIKMNTDGTIARATFSGVMTRRFRGHGILNTEDMVNDIEAMFRSSARVIVMDLDTPGGEVLGTQTAGEKIQALRAEFPSKALLAVTESVMASAGFWIGSQANLIISSNEATVGSIGVIAALVDWSRMLENAGIDVHVIRTGDLKAPGVGKITDPQKRFVSQQVANNFRRFIDAVETSRGMQLSEEVLTGRTFRGDEAIGLGLVDRVGDVSDEVRGTVETIIAE